MPIPVLGDLYYHGLDAIPYLRPSLPYTPYLGLVALLRWYFAGAKNGNERVLHGKVIMVTGGTSGLGYQTAYELASRGAQVILLVRSTHDQFVIDQINDLREATNNILIYAEECDLSSLYSIRKFATKWLDNSPPRRLDMVVCCAGIMNPPFGARTVTQDGVETQWGVNYLAHFHLLNLLSPALRVQPPDRDVRVILVTCAAYLLGDLDLSDTEFTLRGYPGRRPWLVYGASKLALNTFAVEFQRRLDAYQRPDKAPMNTRVFVVDPGYVRSPGTRRWLSFGTIWGLLVYLIMWPLWWLVLKSPKEACQTILTAVMSPECGMGPGGLILKECKKSEFRNPSIVDPETGKALWEYTQAEIERHEKASAIERKKKEGKVKKEKPAPTAAAQTSPTAQASETSSSGVEVPEWATRRKTRSQTKKA